MKKKLQKLAILLCVAIASGMFFTPNNTSAFNSSLFTLCWEPSSVEEKKGAGGAADKSVKVTPKLVQSAQHDRAKFRLREFLGW